jgi:hypothetical protein
MPDPARLRQLRITRVDRVTSGANPDANVVLWKSSEGAPSTPETPQPTLRDQINQAIKKAVNDDLSKIPELMRDPAWADLYALTSYTQSAEPVAKALDALGRTLGRERVTKAAERLA